MKVKLWGVRGSIPSPLEGVDYRKRLERVIDLARGSLESNPRLTTGEIIDSLPPEIGGLVGGETTCIEVTSGSTTLVIDLGTGARRMGYEMASRKFEGDLHIMMTHTHWDHIQGWPFFAMAYNPRVAIHFHSAIDDLETRLSMQQKSPYFPVTFENTPSKKTFHLFQPGDSFQVGPFQISTRSLNHPGGSISYRIECNGKVFIFATDTEIYGNDVEKQMAEYHSFFAKADMLILDGQYSDEESALRVGWGHTSVRMGLRAAVSWKVKSLVFTHHEPAHSDDTIYDLFRVAVAYRSEIEGGDQIELRMAHQGDVFEV